MGRAEPPPLAEGLRSPSQAGPILGRGSYVAAGPAFDPERVDGLSIFAALLDPIPAVRAAKVRVDPDIGNVEILRYVASQDVGFAINPLGVEGQIQGGASEGIGQALSEEMVFDGDGRLLNPTLLDYKMPTALDHPSIEPIIVEGHLGGGPNGGKGVGEPPIGPPPATIANAVCQAIGTRVRKLPLSPENVWQAMRETSGTS